MSILILFAVLLLAIISVLIVIVNIPPPPSRIVVSMTTSPIRILKMKPVLDSLMNQTITPEKIYLSIPELYRGTDSYLIPEWFKDYPSDIIEINRLSKDYGPACKLVGPLDKVKGDTIIVYCDDDIQYPCRMLESHLSLGKKDEVNALDLYQGIYPSGYAGVSVHRSLIGDDFLSFIEESIANKDCYLSDDMVIGEYFHRKGIKINKIESKLYNYTIPAILQGVQGYGLLGDSLWLQDGLSGVLDNHYSKYCRCKEHLEAKFGKSNRYILAVSATEEHLPKIQESMDTLLMQKYRPDKIFLFISKDLPVPKMKRGIEVIRSSNHAIIEIQNLVDANEDTNILFCEAILHPDSMILVHNQYGQKETLNCLPYLGSSPRLATGVSIHRSLLNSSLSDFVQQQLDCDECKSMINLVIWEYFKRKGIESNNVYTTYYNPLKYTSENTVNSSGCLNFMKGGLL